MFASLHSRLLDGSATNGIFMDLEAVGEKRFVKIYKKNLRNCFNTNIILNQSEIEFILGINFSENFSKSSEEYWGSINNRVIHYHLTVAYENNLYTMVKDKDSHCLVAFTEKEFKSFLKILKVYYFTMVHTQRPINIDHIEKTTSFVFYHLIKFYRDQFRKQPVWNSTFNVNDQLAHDGTLFAAEMLLQKQYDVVDCIDKTFVEEIKHITKQIFLVDMDNVDKKKIIGNVLKIIETSPSFIECNDLYKLMCFFFE